MPSLSVDDLLTMSDTAVAPRVPSRFLDFLKAVPEVRQVFFASLPAPAPFPAGVPGVRPLDAGWVKQISVAMVCAAAAKMVVRNFNQIVDGGRANETLDRELAPSSRAAVAASVALYDAEFAANAATPAGTSFQSYLADRPAYWGTELANTVTGNAYRTQIDIKFNVSTIDDQIKLGRHLALVSYMVGRLNGNERQRVAKQFKEWFPQAIDPEPVSHLIRADYTGATFFDAVLNVASTRRYVPPIFVPIASDMPPPPQPDTYLWGEAFTGFVDREAGAYRTGVKPDDWEIVTIFSCFVGGTPVHLSDGSTRAIDTIEVGDAVLAADGAVAVRAPEESARRLEAPQTIHGFNDLPPFVSAGHVFLTAAGPKAIDPAGAASLNPDLSVGRLQVGDRLLRLAGTQPLTLEEVRIDRITTSVQAAGDSLFALVVDGPQSYFANGFLVAANYPSVTEERIAAGIAALSPAEQAHLHTILGPVMPLLKKVLRGFAGPRLMQVLTEATEPENQP